MRSVREGRMVLLMQYVTVMSVPLADTVSGYGHGNWGYCVLGIPIPLMALVKSTHKILDKMEPGLVVSGISRPWLPYHLVVAAHLVLNDYGGGPYGNRVLRR